MSATDSTAASSGTDGMIGTDDYTLKSIHIMTGAGITVDSESFRTHIVEIEIYESLFQSCMSGVIHVVDGIDLPGNFYFHGNEWVTLTIGKPSMKPIFDLTKTFRIYKISNYVPGVASASYDMHLISEEMVISNQTFVSKSYKGMLISDMVKDICVRYLGLTDPSTDEQGSKIALIEATTQQFDLIIPRLEPFEAINWLSTRAYSDAGPSTMFMFFENRYGYQFVSYDTMLRFAQKQGPFREYFVNQPKIDTDPYKNMASITYTGIDHMHDVLASGKNGAYQMSLTTTDILARKREVSPINPQDFKAVLNDNIPDNGTPGRFGNALTSPSSDYVMKHIPVTDYDTTVSQMTPSKWLHSSYMRAATLDTFKGTLTIPGDIVMCCGAVVRIVFPIATPQGDKSRINNQRTGNYLVTGVHHKFMCSTNPIHSTVITVNTDSITGKWPAPASNNPALKQLIGGRKAGS